MASTSQSHWKTQRFDEMAVEVKNRVDVPQESGFDRYVGLEHLDSGSLKIWRWGSTQDVQKQKMLFKSGDIIFGRRNAYLRRVSVADFDGVCSAHAMVLRARPEVALPEFLPFFMQTEEFWQAALRNSAGSLSPTINWSNIAKEEFALPPQEEQIRLAEVLWAAETTINKLRRLRAEVGTLRASAIDELTVGLPAETSTVGNHCEMQNGRPFPGNEYCDDGQRLLRPGNLDSSGYLTWEEDKTKHVPNHYREEASEFVVLPGDVLINLTAQSLEDGFMGRVCFVRDGDESLLNQRIGRFTQFSTELLPEFLFRVLQSSSFQRHAISMCEGSKIKHLFWQHLARFRFPLPSTTEQARIVEELGSIDTAFMDVERRIVSAIKLKGELLRSVRSGRVGSSA